VASVPLCFILFAATNESFAIQTPAAKRLIPTRVRYIKRIEFEILGKIGHFDFGNAFEY
jgi:hypothetical protein